MQNVMTLEQLTRRLCHLAADQVTISPAEVVPTSHLTHDLNFDSLDRAEYAMQIEDEFDVSISDDVAAKVQTVQDAIDALLKAMEVRDHADSHETLG